MDQIHHYAGRYTAQTPWYVFRGITAEVAIDKNDTQLNSVTSGRMVTITKANIVIDYLPSDGICRLSMTVSYPAYKTSPKTQTDAVTRP